MRVQVVRVCSDDQPGAETSVGNAGTLVVVPPGNAATPLVASTNSNGEAVFNGLRVGLTYTVQASVFGDSNGATVVKYVDAAGEKIVKIKMPYAWCNGTGATGGSGGTR